MGGGIEPINPHGVRAYAHALVLTNFAIRQTVFPRKPRFSLLLFWVGLRQSIFFTLLPFGVPLVVVGESLVDGRVPRNENAISHCYNARSKYQYSAAAAAAIVIRLYI